ncbi:unnamed protein product, partial [Brassica oleracea]
MAQFSILLADLKVYNHRRGLSSEFWAMARFNTTAARANHRLHMVFGRIWNWPNQQIYFSDLKVDGTLVLREDCVAELNNYTDPLPENLDGKLLTRILEVDARMGNLEKVMELIRCCKGV